MEFTLNVNIDSTSLETIYAAGSNVIIAKPSSSDDTPNVAWLVFRPFSANQITWQEEYGIYCSTSEFTKGAVLTQLSSVPVGALENQLYTLQSNATIKGPEDGGYPDSFTLKNSYQGKSLMTVGLYQNANVNGTDILNSAISAAPVMFNATAQMTPYTTVYIWLQSNVKSNCVVTDITSPMTKLQFGGGIDTQQVVWDAKLGQFKISSPALKEAAANGRTKIEMAELLVY